MPCQVFLTKTEQSCDIFLHPKLRHYPVDAYFLRISFFLWAIALYYFKLLSLLEQGTSNRGKAEDRDGDLLLETDHLPKQKSLTWWEKPIGRGHP